MKNLTKNIVWAITTLLVIAFVFSFFYSSQKQPQNLTIDQVVQKINANEVVKLVVNGNDIQIQLKNGDQAVSKKETETGLVETLKSYGVDQAALQKVSFEVQDQSGFQFWAGILLTPLLSLIFIGVFFWLMFRQARTGMSQAFTFGKANIKLFTQFKDRVMFSDVAGLKEAKQELIEVVDFLKNPKKYLDIGARIPRGVLLLGSPGTGKTLLARAIAGEGNVPFFHMSGSEFVEMFVGVGSSRVRDLFETAKRAAPCIIFIDEIDAIGRERGAGIGGGHDEREQTLNQLLVEMDGFDTVQGLILIAATNRPDTLDPALLRPGRFDRHIIVHLPDIKGREEILKVHTRKIKLGPSVDLRSVATQTPGFSGADLANLCNEAALLAARSNKEVVELTDFEKSIERVMMGPEKKSRIISKKEKEITAVHESGHALLTLLLPEVNPVKKVSIIPRGLAGGYTFTPPIEDRHYWTRNELLAEIVVALGGRASEELNLREVTTGAQNDLETATQMARRMVCQFGMSDKLGNMTLGKREGLVFLGRDLMEERNYSEETARIIDEEVKKIVDSSYVKAKMLLNDNQEKLKTLSKVLLEKEVMDGEELKLLLGFQDKASSDADIPS